MPAQPLIYFAHANGIPANTYKQLFASLQQLGYQVLYKPIIGIDPNYPVTDEWPNLVRELADHIQQVAGGAKVMYVGHSLGGVLGYLLARQQPELFAGLIMLDPPLFSGWPAFIAHVFKMLKQSDKYTPAGKSKLRREHWDSHSQMAAALRSKGLFAGFSDACFKDYVDSALVPGDQLAYKLAIPVKTEVQIFRYMPTTLWQGKYHKALAVPCHLLSASGGEFKRMGLEKRSDRHLRIPYSYCPGSHMFVLEAPEQVAVVIDALIAKWVSTHAP
jgi:pimeloyl-ACP methyl ester carboxylesterase